MGGHLKARLWKIHLVILFFCSVLFLLFQNLTTYTAPQPVLIRDPVNYVSGKKCALYSVAAQKQAIKIAEISSPEAVKDEAGCKSYIQKYYLNIPNCGYSIGINQAMAVFKEITTVGILEAEGTVTKLSIEDDINNTKILEPSTSMLIMAPSSCSTPEQYRARVRGKSRSIACNYALNSICVSPNTPLFSQASAQLSSYIAQKTGNPKITRDMGWCAPTATAMSILGPLNAQAYEVYQDSYLWKENIPAFSLTAMKSASIDQLTSTYANVIYDLGQTMGIRWAVGGAVPGVALKKIFQRIDPAIRNLNKDAYRGEVLRDFFYLSGAKQTQENLIAKLTAGRQSSVVSTYGHRKKCSHTATVIGETAATKTYEVVFNCQNSERFAPSGSGHALSLNGVEDGYLKMYDPWGRIYNVELKDGKDFPGVPDGPVMIHAGGDVGYVRSLVTPPTRKMTILKSANIDSFLTNLSYQYVTTGLIYGFNFSVRHELNP